MKAKLLVVTLTTLLGAPLLADAPAALPVFGFLEDSAGQPVHGPTDLTFKLYGASDASTHIYSETRSVSVDQGYFSAVLSQGDGGALDLALFSVSDSIYLGVSVGSEPEMTPRVHLTTSPYAAYAQFAGEAASVEGLTAADLSTVGHSHAWGDVTGKPASFPPETHAHAFSSLTTIPAGLADGDDDTVPTMTCGGGNVLTWTGSAFDCVLDANTTYSPATSGGLSMSGTEFSIATGGVTNAHIASNAAIAPSKISGTAWTASNDGAGSGLNADLLDDRSSADFQTAFRRTVVVSPVGTDTENGTALLAALAGITGASASNPYLLKIEPGVYDLGTARLVTKDFVDIAGSGTTRTVIRSSRSMGSPADGAVYCTHDIELRQLTIVSEPPATSTWAIALLVSGSSPRVSDLHAEARQATRNAGVFVRDTADPTLVHVSARTESASATVVNNYSLYIANGTATISSCEFYASGGTSVNRAINVDDPTENLPISHSLLSGSGNTIFFETGWSRQARIFSSSMLGGAVTGDVLCAGVIDENFAFSASTCP